MPRGSILVTNRFFTIFRLFSHFVGKPLVLSKICPYTLFVENLKGFPMVWSKIVLGFKFMSKNKGFGHFFWKKIVRTAEKCVFWRNVNSVGMRTCWRGKSIKFSKSLRFWNFWNCRLLRPSRTFFIRKKGLHFRKSSNSRATRAFTNHWWG